MQNTFRVREILREGVGENLLKKLQDNISLRTCDRKFLRENVREKCMRNFTREICRKIFTRNLDKTFSREIL